MAWEKPEELKESCEDQVFSYVSILRDWEGAILKLHALPHAGESTAKGTKEILTAMEKALRSKDTYPGVQTFGMADTIQDLAREMDEEYKEDRRAAVGHLAADTINNEIQEFVIRNMMLDFGKCQCGVDLYSTKPPFLGK